MYCVFFFFFFFQAEDGIRDLYVTGVQTCALPILPAMAFDTRLLNGVGVFAAVAEAGSFARAAEALGVSNSAVSRAVARMERRLGVRLFDRSPRAVALTDEGLRFHQRVLPLLEAMEEAATAASGAAA